MKRLLIIIGKWRRKNQFLVYMNSNHKRGTDLWYKDAYFEEKRQWHYDEFMAWNYFPYFIPLNEDSNGRRWITFMEGPVMQGGRFKNAYELLNLRALKISKLHKNHIFQSMGKIFCVEFQRVPLKFHTKYLTHTLKDVDFIHIWKFKSSLI